MSLSLLLTLSATALAPALPGALVAQPVCRDRAIVPVIRKPDQMRAHPLAAEPNAAQVLTVLRTEGGCSKAVIVRRDIGGQAVPAPRQ